MYYCIIIICIITFCIAVVGPGSRRVTEYSITPRIPKFEKVRNSKIGDEIRQNLSSEAVAAEGNIHSRPLTMSFHSAVLAAMKRLKKSSPINNNITPTQSAGFIADAQQLAELDHTQRSPTSSDLKFETAFSIGESGAAEWSPTPSNGGNFRGSQSGSRDEIFPMTLTEKYSKAMKKSKTAKSSTTTSRASKINQKKSNSKKAAKKKTANTKTAKPVTKKPKK